MTSEILESPIPFSLHGCSGVVLNERSKETGFQLMDRLWRTVKSAGLATTGINHWVYLPDGRMFVGVALRGDPDPATVASLESLQFVLQRRLRHVHVGPYEGLPDKWKALKADLAARAEAIEGPSLEIYGHHHDDPAQQETTILIGLRPKAS